MRAVERARITRLPTARRIKRSAVEHDCSPTTDAVSDIDNASIKLDQMRIRIIKTFSYGHCKITSMRASPRKLIVATAIIALLAGVAAAQEPPLKSITYRLSMSRPVSHLFEVSILMELPDEIGRAHV